jgi:hypothetical protein
MLHWVAKLRFFKSRRHRPCQRLGLTRGRRRAGRHCKCAELRNVSFPFFRCELNMSRRWSGRACSWRHSFPNRLLLLAMLQTGIVEPLLDLMAEERIAFSHRLQPCQMLGLQPCQRPGVRRRARRHCKCAKFAKANCYAIAMSLSCCIYISIYK